MPQTVVGLIRQKAVRCGSEVAFMENIPRKPKFWNCKLFFSCPDPITNKQTNTLSSSLTTPTHIKKLSLSLPLFLSYHPLSISLTLFLSFWRAANFFFLKQLWDKLRTTSVSRVLPPSAKISQRNQLRKNRNTVKKTDKKFYSHQPRFKYFVKWGLVSPEFASGRRNISIRARWHHPNKEIEIEIAAIRFRSMISLVILDLNLKPPLPPQPMMPIPCI